MGRLKVIGAVTLLLAICIAAIYQKMEILAIVTVIFVGIVVYQARVKQLWDLGFDLLRRSQSAKLGNFEFAIESKKNAFNLDAIASDWVRAILADLTTEQLALLVATFKAGKLEARETSKSNLRVLRSRGLLTHNKASMTDSTEVWLTDLGKTVVSHVASEDVVPPSASLVIKQS